MPKMASLLRSLRFTSTPSTPSTEFTKAKSEDVLFTKTDPAIDGDDCLHDCETCTVKYPRKFETDQDDKLYGNIGGWNTSTLR